MSIIVSFGSRNYNLEVLFKFARVRPLCLSIELTFQVAIGFAANSDQVNLIQTAAIVIARKEALMGKNEIASHKIPEKSPKSLGTNCREHAS